MTANPNIIGVLDAVSSEAITARQSRCAVVRNRNVHCFKCADACTSGCISIIDGKLTIDLRKCVGCGTCATVCPTCALETHNPSDAQLLSACVNAARGGRVTIICTQYRQSVKGMLDPDEFAEVVCLGRVEESLTSALAASGIVEINLVCGMCEHCDQQHGLATAELVAETSNVLLNAWGSSARVAVSEMVPEYVLAEGVRIVDAFEAHSVYFSERCGNAPIVSETDAVASQVAGNSSVHEDAVPALRVMKDGTLPHFLPDRREKLLSNLSSLGNPIEGDIVTRLWGSVVIDGQKCSSCRMCATFCPTGAISKFDNDDSTFGVEHYPGDCVKCGTCRDICPENAIILLDGIKAAYLLDGTVHHYSMKPRDVEMNDAHQIVNTMRQYIDGDVYER